MERGKGLWSVWVLGGHSESNQTRQKAGCEEEI